MKRLGRITIFSILLDFVLTAEFSSSHTVAQKILHPRGLYGEACQVGQRQSPIDIETEIVRYQEFRPFTITDLHQLSIRAGTLYAENTGETLKLKARKDHTLAYTGGGPLSVDYEFVEMHFHWGDITDNGTKNTGSEHKIDGKSYPLELHMVHRNVHDETVDEALLHENGITVLSFKFQIVKDEVAVPVMDTLANITKKYLRKPHSMFDSEAAKKDKDIQGDINVVNFLPVLVDEYFHYHGSLTTGGCQEAVNWVVFKIPLAIHERHLKVFQEMENELGEKIANNFRETQPVNERPVYYHGIELIQKNTINRGSSKGLRSKALPNHEDFILTSPCPPAPFPEPAVMAEAEERKSAEKIWERRGLRPECTKVKEGEGPGRVRPGGSARNSGVQSASWTSAHLVLVLTLLQLWS